MALLCPYFWRISAVFVDNMTFSEMYNNYRAKLLGFSYTGAVD